jgi:hypothetical protein
VSPLTRRPPAEGTPSKHGRVRARPQNFDFDINLVTITEERRHAVDFSSGYYDVAQTVTINRGLYDRRATTIAALKDAKFGAQVDRTLYAAITDQIQQMQDQLKRLPGLLSPGR